MNAGQLGGPDGRIVRRRGSGIVSRDDGDQLMLLDLCSSQYLTLDRTGSLLWREIERPQSVRHLVGLLVSAYAVTDSEAAAAVEAFLEALAERGLLESREEAD